MSNDIENENNSETKKRKIQEENDKIVNKKSNTDTKCVSSYPIIVPIIDRKYQKAVELEKFFVGKLVSKKETSRLVKELSAKFPLEGRFHLKRVRWTDDKDVFEILIRPLDINESVESVSSYTLADVFGNSHINSSGLSDSVIVCDIPKDPALTYEQYVEANKFWPVQRRIDRYLEQLMNYEDQSQDKTKILKYLEICLATAQYGDEKVGCVIVDPATSKVMAISHDYRHHHPIQHAVMVAIDLVSKGQGGGSWDIKSDNFYYLPYSNEEQNKEIDRKEDTNTGKKGQKMSLPYLCTSYELYVSREPCIMCSMALVHSRIRRVYYATQISWGALGSHWNLHLQKGLNHHYEVYKVILDEQKS